MVAQDSTTTTMKSATPSVDQISWVGAAWSPGRLQVEPVDQHQAEAVEQDGDGQQQRIGVRGAQAHREMGEQGEHAEPGAVTGGAGRDGAVAGEADGGVAVDGDAGRPRRGARARPRAAWAGVARAGVRPASLRSCPAT